MSKRILQHPEETADGTKYWRSTGQLARHAGIEGVDRS